MKYFLLGTLLIFPGLLRAQNQTPEERAASISDSVIMMMGGKSNWDQVHYLKWNFFGRRTLYWDKWKGRVRIEIPGKNLVIITNINTREGKAFHNGEAVEQQDSISYYMNLGYRIWANDSYWLIMPFKLKDEGVHATYIGKAADAEGTHCLIIQLTFDQVGVTPENKYLVYINPQTYLVTQWDYYRQYDDPQPSISNVWKDYAWYGKILLSSNRGRYEGNMTDIAVMQQLPEGLFEHP